MKIEVSKRLNVFVDETGELGFSKKSATVSGITMVIHEHSSGIDAQVQNLTTAFSTLGFSKIFHMGDLVMGRNDYKDMAIPERRKIFTTFYRFSTKVNTSYYSILVDKKNMTSLKKFCTQVESQLGAFLTDNLEYFQSFDEIVIYYDDGQAPIGKVLARVFGQLYGYRKVTDFDHFEKKLFQVADMMTFIDKLLYKYKNHIKFTKTEERFFSPKDIKKLLRERENKNLKKN